MKLIFDRVGEADVAAQSEQGYSLAEMQEIALQVGLDPTAVAKAASTLRAPQTSNPLLGAPTRFKDAPAFQLAFPAFLTLLGGSLVAGSARLLPRWAREQERRMEHISRHAVSLLALSGSTDD